MRALIWGWAWCCAVSAGAADYWGNARWVWDNPAGATSSQTNDPRYFRKTFDVSAAPQAATVRITCDNAYTLYVNGEKVAQGAEWQKVGEHDVLKRLKVGKNVIAVEAVNHGGVAGMIAHLLITGSDKKSVSYGTGNDWQASLKADKDWQKAEFDASTWAAAAVLGVPQMGPWGLALDGPGTRPGGATNSSGKKIATSYQSAEQELTEFVVPPDFKIELVAAEPLVVNPISAALDEHGVLYVTESHTYRYGAKGSPVPTPSNPIVKLAPKKGGGYERIVVADGFEDPVMGLVVRDNQLWCTANNFLYHYDLGPDGKAINRKTLLTDKNKAWNPFGLFVLEFGPDGWLYMSVGNHNIDITGPTNSVTSRGGSGIIVRMKPDGSQLERLVHGLRVPYSHEFDPYAQLWVLSNGEGNPDRFVRVIDGVDYHCYSRTNDRQWLIGEHPLAPPTFELAGGACTQLLRYYGGAWPRNFVGTLFGVNWGRHGFPSQNHAIFKYVVDERNRAKRGEIWLTSTDPHFRPTQILLAPDGNLLVCDWYGRDDESELTGRVWKLSYVGKEPVGNTAHGATASGKLSGIAGLGSPDPIVRENSAAELAKRGDDQTTLQALRRQASQGTEPLGAAYALWTLVRIGTPAALTELAAGTEHSDWRVRRLALRLLRRFEVSNADATAQKLQIDRDPAVQLEAALTRKDPVARRDALTKVLKSGAALDEFLRYEGAAHLAQVADAATLNDLTHASEYEVRLAGFIAIDVALWEKTAAQGAAQETLEKLLARPHLAADVPLLIKLVTMNRDARWIPGLLALLSRNDLTPTDTAQAILALRGMSPENAAKLGQEVTRKLLEAARTGQIAFNTPAEKLTLLELLTLEGPTPYALAQLSKLLGERDGPVRERAHDLARDFGKQASSLADGVRRQLNGNATVEQKIEAISTLACIEDKPGKDWTDWLVNQPEPVRKEVVRSWRQFANQPDLARALLAAAPELIKSDASYKSELRAILVQLKISPSEIDSLYLLPAADQAELAKLALSGHSSRGQASLGRQVFRRAGCTKCHVTSGDVKLGPSLAGIGKAQKPEYLIESVLEPSKIIKTGFETESVQTVDGKVLSGMVRDAGDALIVIEAEKETRVLKKDVEARSVQKKSIMPEGQEKQLSAPEFVDLIAYLVSLKTGGAPAAK